MANCHGLHRLRHHAATTDAPWCAPRRVGARDNVSDACRMLDLALKSHLDNDDCVSLVYPRVSHSDVISCRDETPSLEAQAW